MPVADNMTVHFTTTLFALIRESLAIKMGPSKLKVFLFYHCLLQKFIQYQHIPMIPIFTLITPKTIDTSFIMHITTIIKLMSVDIDSKRLSICIYICFYKDLSFARVEHHNWNFYFGLFFVTILNNIISISNYLHQSGC